MLYRKYRKPVLAEITMFTRQKGISADITHRKGWNLKMWETVAQSQIFFFQVEDLIEATTAPLGGIFGQ
jgi:hypothetical protein